MTEQCPSASLSLHEVQAVLHIKSAPAIFISLLFELDSLYFVCFLVLFHFSLQQPNKKSVSFFSLQYQYTV